MLEYIFGSKTRLKLLHLFLKNPNRGFFVRELARRTKSQLNAVRREIANLLKIQLIIAGAPLESVDHEKEEKKSLAESKRKYYRLNHKGKLNQELLTLLIKDQLLTEENFINNLKGASGIDYIILSGRFVGEDKSPTDLLIVGSIAGREAKRLIKFFEKESGSEIRYTLMPRREFLYRRDVADKFLSDLLGSEHVIALDKMSAPKSRNT